MSVLPLTDDNLKANLDLKLIESCLFPYSGVYGVRVRLSGVEKGTIQILIPRGQGCTIWILIMRGGEGTIQMQQRCLLVATESHNR